MKILLIILFSFLPVLSQTLYPDVVWLSNSPPPQIKKQFKRYGMGGLYAKRGKRGKTNVYVWPREGASIGTARYLREFSGVEPELLFFAPDGKQIKGKTEKTNKIIAYSYEGNEEGYYNIFLILRREVGDTLKILTAKAENLSHSCRNGHDKALLIVKPKYFASKVPVDIIRERTDLENLHFVITPGEEITYRIFVEGYPAKVGTATLITQNGWMKTKAVDEEGRVSFKFIQDEIPQWENINKRKSYTYLLIYKSIISKTMPADGKPAKILEYTGTYSGRYRPSVTLYSSMLWALIVFVLFIIISAAGVYLYRRKGVKEFKEIAINE